jgi:hypothetical protein
MTRIQRRIRTLAERIAMDLTGHRTRSVLDRYNVTNEEDLRQAGQRLAAYVEGLPTDGNTITLVQGSGTERDRTRTGASFRIKWSEPHAEGWPSGRWRWS